MMMTYASAFEQCIWPVDFIIKFDPILSLFCNINICQGAKFGTKCLEKYLLHFNISFF